MKFVIFCALVIALVACSKKPDRIYSVEELLADQQLLSDMIAKCRNNPGDLRATSNCMNADAADWKASLLGIRKAPGG